MLEVRQQQKTLKKTALDIILHNISCINAMGCYYSAVSLLFLVPQGGV